MKNIYGVNVENVFLHLLLNHKQLKPIAIMKTYVFPTFTVLLLLMCSTFTWGQRNMQQRSKFIKPTNPILVEQPSTTTTPVTENISMYAPAAIGYNVNNQYLIANATLQYELGGNYAIGMGNTNGLSASLTGDLKSYKVNAGWVMWLFSGADYNGEKKVLSAGDHSVATLGEAFKRPGSAMLYEAGEIVLFSGANFQGESYRCNAKGLSQTLNAVPADFPTEVGSYANFGSTAGLFKSGNSNLWNADFGIVAQEKRTLTESQTTNFRNKAFVNWVKM
jgi:hypothetical protein